MKIYFVAKSNNNIFYILVNISKYLSINATFNKLSKYYVTLVNQKYFIRFVGDTTKIDVLQNQYTVFSSYS